jgi:hypothetical protein
MTSSEIIEVTASDWHCTNLSVPRETLLAGLERGKVLYFSNLEFAIEPDELGWLDPAVADPARKNISLPAEGGSVLGVQGGFEVQRGVQAMIARYQGLSRQLIAALLPEYQGALRAAPTSLRLHQVQDRLTSWRKDDSRLHIDAFPSRPNRGERILRVFTNINPHGVPRVWRVGEPFEQVAQRFLPNIKSQLPGSAWLLKTLSITKSRRSAYDHLMLNLHDAMKADLDYQREAPQQTMPFPSGCVWVCFSDQTSHAVMSGQFMLEQTFFMPAHQMVAPECAPPQADLSSRVVVGRTGRGRATLYSFAPRTGLHVASGRALRPRGRPRACRSNPASVGSRGIGGRNACRRAVDRRPVAGASRPSDLVDAHDTQWPGHRRAAIRFTRAALLFALRHAESGPTFSAGLATEPWRADGNRSLAHLDR